MIGYQQLADWSAWWLAHHGLQHSIIAKLSPVAFQVALAHAAALPAHGMQPDSDSAAAVGIESCCAYLGIHRSADHMHAVGVLHRMQRLWGNNTACSEFSSL
jgi:hypothetical protein